MFFLSRYDTWNEIYFPNRISTGVILGQLPGPEHVGNLIHRHHVSAVLSCVEKFELERYGIGMLLAVMCCGLLLFVLFVSKAVFVKKNVFCASR